MLSMPGAAMWVRCSMPVEQRCSENDKCVHTMTRPPQVSSSPGKLQPCPIWYSGFGTIETHRASPLGYTDCDRVQKLFNESLWHVTTHPLVYCSYTGYHDLHTRGPNAIMWPHLAFPQPFHTRRHPPYICFGYATNVWKYVSIVDS